MAVVLRPLRLTDAERCAELEQALFPGDDPWTAEMFRSELDWGVRWFAASDGELLVGYAGISFAGVPGDMEGNVHNIGVDPAWQGKGIGRLLLTALLDEADAIGARVFLEVRTDNAVAIGLYRSYGFERIGLRRRYYQQSGADAYTMARPSKGER